MTALRSRRPWPCAVFRFHRGRLAKFPVAQSEGETPLPIPNRAVKPLSADGTWPARAWESRSPPVYLYSANDRMDTMTDARSGGASPGASGNGTQQGTQRARHPVAAYFRANPQVFVLLVVCLVLGLGTFL